MENPIKNAQETKKGNFGPDSPQDPKLFPLKQDMVNEMWKGLMKVDGYSYASPEAAIKTDRIYK